MNEITFVLALLLHKDVITATEAKELHAIASTGTLNGSLADNMNKIDKALKTAAKDPLEVQRINAKDLFKA